MNLTVKGRNTEVTSALREYVDKRFAKLEKYFNKEMHGTVTLIVEKNEHIAEATIPLNRFILRAEEQSNDMYTSIDNIVEKLERQIRKYKTRVNRKGRQQNLDVVPFRVVEEEPQEDTADAIGEIAKVKRFIVKPMDPEEAIMQMELLDHDFFVFLNSETDAVEVVYRRKDGKYGQIQPEVE